MESAGGDWDPHKAQQNLRKRGVRFELACRVFDDPHRDVELDARDYGEERWITVGNVGLVILVVANTYRNGRRRLISARRAERHKEWDYWTTLTNAPERGKPEQIDPWTLMSEEEWARLRAMTEEALHQNALDDPDNPPLTDEQLARMRRAPHPHEIRSQLGLTQREFARTFEIALGTLRDWEQGSRRLDSAAEAYLRVIQHDPDAVIAALAASRPSPTALPRESELPKTGTG